MCWGGPSPNAKLGVKSKWNQTGYQSILQHHAIPSGTQLVDQGFLLMRDNDPKHTSKLCQRYIKGKEEQHALQLMFWPVQSADLNPIELVWDVLDRKVRAKQATNAAHLGQLLRESWAELSSVFVGKNPKNLWSSDSGQRGSFWSIKSLRDFFFLFNLYLMWLKKTCI